jgi:hypothetical protein
VYAGSRAADERRLFVWLFLAAFLIYWFTAGSNFTSGDAYAELNVSNSLLRHGWFDVPVMRPGQICAGWGCLGVDGRYYASHGIGYSLWLIPFLLLADMARQLTAAPNCGEWSTCLPIHLITWNTCLLTAATVALLGLLCRSLATRRAPVCSWLCCLALPPRPGPMPPLDSMSPSPPCCSWRLSTKLYV